MSKNPPNTKEVPTPLAEPKEAGLLDLDELAPELPHIVIGGVTHEMILPYMLSLDEAACLRRVVRDVQKYTRDVDNFEEGTSKFEAARKQLHGATDKLLTVLVPSLSDEVKKDLDERKKSRILAFFMAESVAHLNSSRGTSAISLLGMLSGTEQMQSSSSGTDTQSGKRSRRTSRV